MLTKRSGQEVAEKRGEELIQAFKNWRSVLVRIIMYYLTRDLHYLTDTIHCIPIR